MASVVQCSMRQPRLMFADAETFESKNDFTAVIADASTFAARTESRNMVQMAKLHNIFILGSVDLWGCNSDRDRYVIDNRVRARARAYRVVDCL